MVSQCSLPLDIIEHIIIFLADVKNLMLIFVLADVIANFFYDILWHILLPYLWQMFVPLICGRCF